MKDVPFHRAEISPRAATLAAQAVTETLGTGERDGCYTSRCLDLLRVATDTADGALTTSATSALELIASLFEIGPGDEVIVPSFTFPSSAAAFALRGASIRFADICGDSLTIDPESVASLVSPRTKAVVAVHYGTLADVASLRDVVDPGRVVIIEDAAVGFLGSRDGIRAGGLGRAAALSFAGTKHVTCGEGGALMTTDPELVARIDVLADKGTNRQAFRHHEVDKYEWVDIGSSYRLSEVLAAMLLDGLERTEVTDARRRFLSARYGEQLSRWAELVGAQLPAAGPGSPSNSVYPLLLRSPQQVEPFMKHAAVAGVGCATHYVPLHLSRMGRALSGGQAQCPTAESVASRLVRLPLYSSLTDDEQAQVVDAVGTWFP